MFHHPSEPVSISRFSRSRTSVRPIRARTESIPPSNTHEGIVASRPLPPAVYGYMSAATSTPRARAASISAAASLMIVPQPGSYAPL